MNRKTRRLLKTLGMQQKQLDTEAAIFDAYALVKQRGYPPGRLVYSVRDVLRANRKIN